jgi:hypothetical protein
MKQMAIASGLVSTMRATTSSMWACVSSVCTEPDAVRRSVTSKVISSSTGGSDGAKSRS